MYILLCMHAVRNSKHVIMTLSVELIIVCSYIVFFHAANDQSPIIIAVGVILGLLLVAIIVLIVAFIIHKGKKWKIAESFSPTHKREPIYEVPREENGTVPPMRHSQLLRDESDYTFVPPPSYVGGDRSDGRSHLYDDDVYLQEKVTDQVIEV